VSQTTTNAPAGRPAAPAPQQTRSTLCARPAQRHLGSQLQIGLGQHRLDGAVRQLGGGGQDLAVEFAQFRDQLLVCGDFGPLASSKALGAADLTGADLEVANLRGANLTGAQLAGANLAGVWWPEGVPVPEGWIVDGTAGGLKRAGGLSEVTDHYP
jgi:Pentapeptide repeats (8 copies)